MQGQVCGCHRAGVLANPSQSRPHTALRDKSISEQMWPFQCGQQRLQRARDAGVMSPPVSRTRPRRHLSTPCPPSPDTAAAPQPGTRVPPPPFPAWTTCPPCPSRPVPVPTTTTSNSVGRLSAILGGAVTRAPPAERAGAVRGFRQD